MNSLLRLPVHKILLAGLMAASIATTAAAQQAEAPVQESLDFGQLLITPNIMFGIPYAKYATSEAILPANLNVDTRLTVGKVLDAHATLHAGYFKGATLGGTLHLRDFEKTRTTRYMVAEVTSGRTTTRTFYRAPGTRRIAIGPTVDLKIGSVTSSGFYSRLDAGLDLEIWGRSFYKGYPSVSNGLASVRLLGTFARFNQFEYSYTGTNFQESPVGRTGIGALVSGNVWRSPWKTATIYLGLDGGYMAIMGVKDALSIENNKENYILEIRMGLGLNFFKKGVRLPKSGESASGDKTP